MFNHNPKLKISEAHPRSKSILRKRTPQSTNNQSMGKSRNSIVINTSFEQAPFIKPFTTPRNNFQNSDLKHQKMTIMSPSQTDCRVRDSSLKKSRTHTLCQQLQKTLEDNVFLEAALSKLSTEKAQAQIQRVRLSEQITMLTQSQSIMVSLSSSANQRVTDLKEELEERGRISEIKLSDCRKQMERLAQLLKQQKQTAQEAERFHRDERQTTKNTAQMLKSQIQVLKETNLKLINKIDFLENKLLTEQQLVDSTKAECKQVQIKLKEAERALHQSQQKIRAMQLKLSEQSKQAGDELISAKQIIQQIKSANSQFQDDIKVKHTAQIQKINHKHKEKIDKVQKNYLRQLKQIRQFAQGNIKIKQKEIDLLRLSTASEIQKTNTELAQLSGQLSQKDSVIRNLQKKIYSLDRLLQNHEQTQGQLEQQTMNQRMKIQQMEAHIVRLNRYLIDVKSTNEKSKIDSSIDSSILLRDQTIKRLEDSNAELSEQCDELVDRLQKFYQKVHDLEAHMQQQAKTKQSLYSRIKQLELRSTGTNNNSSHEENSRLTDQIEYLRRIAKQGKMKLRQSDDKHRQMQILLDEANQKLSNYQFQIQRLSKNSIKSNFSSRDTSRPNQTSERNIILTEQLAREQFKCELLLAQIRILKENRGQADFALRTIDTNIICRQQTDLKFQKTTI